MYIEKKLSRFNNAELAELWQRFVHGEYDEIRPMVDFDDAYANSPSEIAEDLGRSKHFHTSDPYWRIDSATGAPESGTLKSIFDEVYDEDVLASAIMAYENDSYAMNGIDWPTDEQLVEDELIAFVNDITRGGWEAPYNTERVLAAFAKVTNNIYKDTVEWLFDGLDEEYADKDDFIAAIETA